MAFESAAKVKFAIKNSETGHEETVASEIAYQIREEEQTKQPQQEESKEPAAQKEDEDPVFDILLSHQAVVKQVMLSNALSVSMITAIGETQLEVDFETTQDVRPEILMQAKLQFARKRIFDFIQEL